MKKKFGQLIKNILVTVSLPVGLWMILFLVTKGRFGTLETIVAVLRTSAVPLLIGMAMSFNMMMNMWDFSTGAVIYAAAIFAANISNELSMGIPGLCLFCIVIAVALSAFSGFIYNRMRIPCLVLSIGLAMVYEALPSMFIKNSTGKIGILSGYLAQQPWSLLIVAGAFVLFYVLYNYTVIGKDIQAIGANIVVANNAGVNLDRVKFFSFVIGGFFLGLAAIEHISLNISVSAASGFSSSNIIFDSMMGVFIGVVLSKYCNYCVSVVVGVITIRMLGTGLVACGLSTQARSITTGIFLLVLLVYSANKGALAALRERKRIAQEANAAYDAVKQPK